METGKQEKMAALSFSANSATPSVVDPIQYRQVAPTKIASQNDLALNLEISSPRAHDLTRFDTLPAERIEDITPFDLQNYFKVSAPPTIAPYSKKELENYFKISSAPTVAKYIDPADHFRHHGESLIKYPEYIMDAPRIVSWVELIGTTQGPGGVDSEHTWICNDDMMSANEIIPGIPEAYSKEYAEGRALYAVGIPPTLTPSQIIKIFELCGKVDKCPIIIATKAECTFYWIIMATAEGANAAMETRSGLNMPGTKGRVYTMYICKSLPPGKSVPVSEFWNLAGYSSGNGEAAQKMSHGHPEVPVKSTTNGSAPRKTASLAPIPKVLPPGVASSSQANAEIEPGSSISAATKRSEAAVKPISWANIAGNVTAASKTIDLRAGTKSNEIVAVRKLSVQAAVVTRSSDTEPLIDQARVIFLLELPQNMTMADVSNGISEGPLHTIQFGVNEDTRERYAGVIFQYAQDAESFHKALCKEREKKTPGRFRFIVEARRGEEPFPADATMKLMGHPTFATRRLTIVKSRFFFVYKAPQLRALFEKKVGPVVIQLIWLYNGGNATVVFARVEDAIAVKKCLDSLSDAAEESSHFYGLYTSFSRDPCVQPIRLISDLHS